MGFFNINNWQIKKNKLFIYLMSFSLILLLIFTIYSNFIKKNEEKDIAYSEFILNICDSALKYVSINEHLVEKKIDTIYYIQIQDLIDSNLISLDDLINPAYNKNLFGFSKYNKYLSPTLFVKLVAGTDYSFFCEEITSNND